MRIMVFDVPAESGGALSVLHEFYNELKLDQENEYVFVLSLPELEETSNITVLRFPWIKKSWGHRLYFDHFIAPKLIKEYDIDQVLSLQNVTIPRTKVYQRVLVHNALPFSEYRFRLKEDKFLWIYQNIIGRKIMKAIKKADYVIVQTNWMKEKIIERLNIDGNKIEIKSSKINIEIKEQFNETKDSLSTFFYPASGVIFKNHKVIVDACLKLKEEKINDYRVVFTLTGNENPHIAELYKRAVANELPFEFSGYLETKKVFELYRKSVLVFPSYVETVGLPLLEAKKMNSPIIVSNHLAANEILNTYTKYTEFNPSSADELYEIMRKFIEVSRIS